MLILTSGIWWIAVTQRLNKRADTCSSSGLAGHSEESCLCQQKHHCGFNHLFTWLCQLRWLNWQVSPEVRLVGVSPCLSRFRGKSVPVQAMRLYEGVEVLLQSYLTSALDRGDRSVPRPQGQFSPGKELLKTPPKRWFPETVCMLYKLEISLCPAGNVTTIPRSYTPQSKLSLLIFPLPKNVLNYINFNRIWATCKMLRHNGDGLNEMEVAVRTQSKLQLASSSSNFTEYVCYFMPHIFWMAMFAFTSACSQIYYLEASAVGFPHMVVFQNSSQ